ncbi:uncharacterized protein [Rutidosis leptorrhynchoides]|uniref:uncharacterized protein n=1 Tax=Rutidosis leptorrhynchoides TaxID=125765 RepID=UPI003A98CE4E
MYYDRDLTSCGQEDLFTSLIGKNSDAEVDSLDNDNEVQSKDNSPLTDAVSVSSIQEIVKEEYAYNRKRKNMISHSILSDMFHTSTMKRSQPVFEKR